MGSCSVSRVDLEHQLPAVLSEIPTRRHLLQSCTLLRFQVPGLRLQVPGTNGPKSLKASRRTIIRYTFGIQVHPSKKSLYNPHIIRIYPQFRLCTWGDKSKCQTGASKMSTYRFMTGGFQFGTKCLACMRLSLKGGE